MLLRSNIQEAVVLSDGSCSCSCFAPCSPHTQTLQVRPRPLFQIDRSCGHLDHSTILDPDHLFHAGFESAAMESEPRPTPANNSKFIRPQDCLLKKTMRGKFCPHRRIYVAQHCSFMIFIEEYAEYVGSRGDRSEVPDSAGVSNMHAHSQRIDKREL